jgi:signal transduction histidine kinase
MSPPEEQHAHSSTAPAPKRFGDLQVANLAQWIARLLSLMALAVSAVALTEYASGVPLTATWVPGLLSMSPLTALALLCLALSALAARYQTFARGCTAIAGSIAFTVLCSYLLMGTDVLSEAIASQFFPNFSLPIGQTSPATASCLGLLSLARAAQVHGYPKACDLFATLTFGVAGTGLLGYAYGVEDLNTVLIFNTMAAHTAFALLCLALSMMLVQADQGWLSVVTMKNRAGVLTRRQLLLTAVLPIMGWLLLWAIHSKALGPPAALALVVAVVFLPLVILIIKDGRVTARLEGQRLEQQRLESTIRRRLELELEKKRSELERESAQRLVAEQAVSRTQRLEAVGQLTGGIAHDFNNLLMGISGNLELLQRQVEGNPKAIGYVARASLSTEKGIRLTAQLLAFSRTQRLNIAAVDLRDTLSAALELVGNALGPTVRIDMRPPGEALLVRTDPLQLEMAILNLALNARDAMPDGGCFSVACSVAEPMSNGQEAVSIKVSDTGTGMSAAVLAKACEPFFTTKEPGRGTGLGLAQVYGLCRQCEGDLKVTSTLGEGSCFELLLPRAERLQASEPVPQVVRSAAYRAVPEQPILIVDDDDSVRAVLVDNLKARGYRVLATDRGSEALALLESAPCAAAVFDFLMPEMNGAELARKARAMVPDLPIVFISGYSDTLALDTIDGAVVLRKPFDLERLDEVLKDLILLRGQS